MDFSISPVIAAVRNNDDFERALKSGTQYIFLLNSDILTLKDRIKSAKDLGKKIYVHVDFTEGLGKDKVAMEAVARLSADGIITTRTATVRLAKEVGLSTVQRFFLVDSHSFDTAVEAVKTAKPDMIEVMPGLVTKEISRFCEVIKIPIIAGGLLETKSEVYSALSSGASAVSTGLFDLWE